MNAAKTSPWPTPEGSCSSLGEAPDCHGGMAGGVEDDDAAQDERTTQDAAAKVERTTQDAALKAIIGLLPARLTLPELLLFLADKRGKIDQNEFEDAVCNLERFGAVRVTGKVLEPTFAALRTADVLGGVRPGTPSDEDGRVAGAAPDLRA